jgi:hypothetical protein
MEKAIWLSYIFGPYLVILGLWMLLYHENMMKVVTSVKNTPGLFYLSSLFNLLVGLAIIDTYNSWPSNLAFLVSLLGWAMAIRGVCGLFVPQLVANLLMTNDVWLRIKGIFPLGWGILLCILAGMKQ